MLDKMAVELHRTAVTKGFWPEVEDVDDIFVAKQFMMIVSEVVEAMEAVRKNKGEEEIAKEFADIIIRTLDLYAGMVEAGYTEQSLDHILSKKAEFNTTRPEKHGVRF